MSLLTPIYTAVNALGVLLTRLTADRAAALDKLDAAISTRATAATALSSATWTNTRAGKLDQLDAAVTSRASADTALSSATWTTTRAGKLDQLDAAVSSRMAGIKGIQRGVLQINSGLSSATTTITAVDPAKTELRLLGFYLASTDSTNNQLVALQLTNATTLTATRGATSGGNCSVSWELTEYL